MGEAIIHSSKSRKNSKELLELENYSARNGNSRSDRNPLQKEREAYQNLHMAF
jgi:hypothetical protein